LAQEKSTAGFSTPKKKLKHRMNFLYRLLLIMISLIILYQLTMVVLYQFGILKMENLFLDLEMLMDSNKRLLQDVSITHKEDW
jgi:hypothetical protein